MNITFIAAAATREATAVAGASAPARRCDRLPIWLILPMVFLVASVLAEPAKTATPASGSTEMRLVQQYPHAHELMSGSGVAFALGFDRPVNHAASYFILVAPGGHQRTVRVRLNSAPNTLYASVGRLDPGDYRLVWQARAADGHALAGTFPFTVGR
ncbi:MAG TPA: copper resistance CopC family protein [Acetobacteraceae bacterium]|nr:copper resistance CopC family protein [Acetobacteraceae bacterium]